MGQDEKTTRAQVFGGLTDRQIEALLLIIPGVGKGLSNTGAANHMGISRQMFQGLLSRARKARPDLFPILTQQEYEVLTLIECGLTIDEIAERLWSPRKGETGVSRSRVEKIMAALRDKGRDVMIDRPDMVSYQSWMDSEVEEKF